MADDDKLLLVPATISRITTFADRTLRLNVDTDRELLPNENAMLFELNNKSGFFLFKLIEIVNEDLLNVPESKPISESKGKSPQQILRNRLFVYYKSAYGKKEGFEEWYIKTVDIIGMQYLAKIKQ
jgi:hypothetical protein